MCFWHDVTAGHFDNSTPRIKIRLAADFESSAVFTEMFLFLTLKTKTQIEKFIWESPWVHACIYYSSESLHLYRCILGAIVGSFIWELIVVEDVLLSYEERGGITPRFKELPKAGREKKIKIVCDWVEGFWSYKSPKYRIFPI